MSINADVLCSQLNRLKPATTVETSITGEKSINGVHVHSSTKSFGFVEDTSIDLTLSPILPDSLYVSSIDAALHIPALTDNRIGCIINLSGQSYSLPSWRLINCDSSILSEPPSDHILYEIECLDLVEQPLDAIGELCSNIIGEALSNNIRVLVHCQLGASRSVSIIIWYLMTRFAVLRIMSLFSQSV
ncbi:hypothetical protein BCR33DRAFT_724226 [Rhizoclosmatium globosum]|uniref:Tyrosine-protein phosphatase domain-containing protein n=1 Tax=Rhizoclosmatium globosum TaxID=329046 RepID=A0A1Y2B818_9FUNG|nr:hypothetical protein BCR33DRAFT_724226 [Rhizoclosmatium globosum]|eukprot:ORY30680.1 hypothetical protein BCR33DRAFT_724226 [Rhizoclosmatium globosum]